MKNYLWNLQIFAEGEPAGNEPPANDPTGTQGNEQSKAEQTKVEPQLKYTDEDVDAIFSKKFAEWQKKQEKAVTQAQKLANMTAEEKTAQKMADLEARLQDYEAKAARAEMTKQARAMLQDKNINVNDELLGCLIAADAETTKASVESFMTLFNAAVENAVKEAVKGTTPKKGAAPTMTKEQIMAVANQTERQRLINENLQLFRN